MKKTTVLILLVLPNFAHAHWGHLGDVAGHGHWIGAAAIGLAIALGAKGILSSAKDKGKSETDAKTQDDTEVQDA